MNTSQQLDAAGRVCQILSRSYCAPGDNFAGDDLPTSLRSAFSLLQVTGGQDALAELESYLAGCPNLLDLAREYVRLFRGPVKALVYPYESMHVDGEMMGPSTMAVERCYRDVGLGVSEDFRDLPDHISAELEFVHYLYALEAASVERGDAADARRLREVRSSFLSEHLASWVPRFADAIGKQTTSPFYRNLAKVTSEFLSFQVDADLRNERADARRD